MKKFLFTLLFLVLWAESSYAQNHREIPLGSTLEIRISDLEGQLQELTGKLEELEFKVNKLDAELSKQVAAPTPPTPPKPTAADLTTSSPKTLYDEAFSLLKQEKYQESTQVFQKFIKDNPSNPMVANSYYWLGEISYVNNDYNQAAVYFLQGYTAFPNGDKAPDNLLKLAMSLAFMGKKKEACTTFDKISSEFPQSSAAIKQRVMSERTRLECL